MVQGIGQVRLKIRYRSKSLVVDANQHNLMRHRTSAVIELEECWNTDDRCDRFQIIAGNFANFIEVPIDFRYLA